MVSVWSKTKIPPQGWRKQGRLYQSSIQVQDETGPSKRLALAVALVKDLRTLWDM
jgi:hypothetical protein